MTALLEKVLAQAYQVPETEQDALAERLLQTLTEFQGEQGEKQEKPRPRFGSAKGMFTLPPDFDAPLEDFPEPADPQKEVEPKQPKRKAGSARGQIWMSEDFDAPLEDFAEYT